MGYPNNIFFFAITRRFETENELNRISKKNYNIALFANKY